ncbi:hypothetical protein O3800_04675 [Gemella sanguinis]|uniref:hypothetical protein n=1 Tax=Gemella sanguinis TaxID=84135 RepID=UPI00352F467E
MITAEKNKYISDRVYKVGKGNEVEYEGIYNFNDRNEELGKFKIIDLVDSGNGMQAMATASVDSNGEVEIF